MDDDDDDDEDDDDDGNDNDNDDEDDNDNGNVDRLTYLLRSKRIEMFLIGQVFKCTSTMIHQ